jgi:dynactin 1
MPHLSDARSAKSSFQLTTILAYVKQIASSTVAKDIRPGESAWEAIGASISQLIQEGSKLLPSAMEPENVVKGKFLPQFVFHSLLINHQVTGVAPWVTRIAELKASMAINVEAERKVAQLNDEMQGLVRSLKTRDQSIQESTVKIELLERRMEASKKQADGLLALEGELLKARKQERHYEEAMEQLQADLDTLEPDKNGKVRSLL